MSVKYLLNLQLGTLPPPIFSYDNEVMPKFPKAQLFYQETAH